MWNYKCPFQKGFRQIQTRLAVYGGGKADATINGAFSLTWWCVKEFCQGNLGIRIGTPPLSQAEVINMIKYPKSATSCVENELLGLYREHFERNTFSVDHLIKWNVIQQFQLLNQFYFPFELGFFLGLQSTIGSRLKLATCSHKKLWVFSGFLRIFLFQNIMIVFKWQNATQKAFCRYHTKFGMLLFGIKVCINII
jgi:hypothetical protein